MTAGRRMTCLRLAAGWSGTTSTARVPWVQVREAVERIGLSEEVVHVEGTEVAYLRKGELGRSAGEHASRSDFNELAHAVATHDSPSAASASGPLPVASPGKGISTGSIRCASSIGRCAESLRDVGTTCAELPARSD